MMARGFLEKFAHGFAGGAADVIDFQMKQDAVEKAATAAEERRFQLEQRRDELARQRNREVVSRAGELANAGRNANLDQAAEIYRKSGMSEADIQAGLGAVDEARKTPDAPTADHLVQAAGEMGFLSPMDTVARADKKEQTDYARGQDEITNKRADEKFQFDKETTKAELGLRRQQLSQSAALNNLQVKAAKLAFERAQDEAKIPPAVEKQYKVLAAEYENKSKVVDSAIAKGEFDAEGMGSKLIEQQAAIALKMQDLLAPYMPASSKPSFDTLYPPKNKPATDTGLRDKVNQIPR